MKKEFSFFPEPLGFINCSRFFNHKVLHNLAPNLQGYSHTSYGYRTTIIHDYPNSYLRVSIFDRFIEKKLLETLKKIGFDNPYNESDDAVKFGTVSNQSILKFGEENKEELLKWLKTEGAA